MDAEGKGLPERWGGRGGAVGQTVVLVVAVVVVVVCSDVTLRRSTRLGAVCVVVRPDGGRFSPEGEIVKFVD